MPSQIDYKEGAHNQKPLQREARRVQRRNRSHELYSCKKTDNSFGRKIEIRVHSAADAMWRVHGQHHVLRGRWASVYLVHYIGRD